MTQKELDNINKSIRSGSVELTLLKLIGKAPKSSGMTVQNIEIVEYHALPADYFLRDSVRDAVMLEILNDILMGEPIPSGVNLIGGETKDEQTKGPDGESEPLSKPGRARGPRTISKASRPKPNSGRKNTVSGGDAKATKLKRSEKEGVGEN